MRPTQKLGDLIAVHMSKSGDLPEQQPETDFILSGIRAAISANLVTRRRILSDVADVLGCKAQDLEFLFVDFGKSAQPNASYEVMVPDFQSELLAAAE